MQSKNSLPTIDQVKNILPYITENYILISNDFTLVDICNKILKILNKNKNDIIGKSVWDININAKKLFYNPTIKTLKTQQPLSFTCPAPITPNKYYKYHFYPLHDGVLSYFEDITDEILYKQELESIIEKQKENESKLTQSNNNLENFNNYLQHDIKNIISSIQTRYSTIDLNNLTDIDFQLFSQIGSLTTKTFDLIKSTSATNSSMPLQPTTRYTLGLPCQQRKNLVGERMPILRIVESDTIIGISVIESANEK